MDSNKNKIDIQNKVLSILTKQFGYEFKSWLLVQEALTRQSAIEENKKYASLYANQRLEFLGDSVLGMVIADLVYSNFPLGSKTEINLFKNEIVKNSNLGKIGMRMRIGSLLIVGKGEEASRIRSNTKTIADLLEALIAVIYLDSGLDLVRTKRAVVKVMNKELKEMFMNLPNFLFKNEEKWELVLD